MRNIQNLKHEQERHKEENELMSGELAVTGELEFSGKA